MKVSLQWLADYIDVTALKADLAGTLEKLTMRGLEVEAITDLSAGFDKVVVAQVVTKDQHPNATKLSLCKVSDGAETFQIVCGAQNFKAGDKVALSKIGASLPNGIKIQASKIRDVESFGMLCSETELGIAEQSDGILILPADAELGTPLAKFLGRDDVVFDINVTPNRGDALSMIGVARELAAVLGQKLKMPDSSVTEKKIFAATKVKVALEDGKGCPQYHGRYLENVTIKPSPAWLKARLEACGVRSINNVVDVTNFIMLEFGTPLHAFDYDLLETEAGSPKDAPKQIRVRRARDGETLELLDGTTAKLSVDDLVIADGVRPIALAGVMGGANSEVSDKTVRILLEGAEFHYSTVRKTARRHAKKTEASHRFERQIDPLAVTRALDRAAKLIAEVSGGTILEGRVSAVAKECEDRVRDLAAGKKQIVLNVANLNKTLGTSLTVAEIHESLKLAGFEVKASSGSGPDAQISVAMASYRPDVTMPEDLYEEVLRVWGYEKVPSVVPKLSELPESSKDVQTRFRLINKLRGLMAAQGFNECLNFGFTSRAQVEQWLDADTKAEQIVTLQNPLNEEFSTLKTSLLSGLFHNLMHGLNHQQKNLRLFEVRPVYFRDEKIDRGVREEWRLSGFCVGRAGTASLASQDRGLDFFDVKGLLESVFESLGARGIRFQEGVNHPKFHPYQSVKIVIGPGACGILGRIHPKVEADHKTRQPVFGFELSLDRLLSVVKTERKYAPLPKFPKVTRDFSLLVPLELSADKITQTVQKLGKPLIESVSVVDVYVGDKIPSGNRSVSISTVLSDPSKTLEDADIDALSQKLIAGLDRELGVKLRTE